MVAHSSITHLVLKQVKSGAAAVCRWVVCAHFQQGSPLLEVPAVAKLDVCTLCTVKNDISIVDLATFTCNYQQKAALAMTTQPPAVLFWDASFTGQRGS